MEKVEGERRGWMEKEIGGGDEWEIEGVVLDMIEVGRELEIEMGV